MKTTISVTITVLAFVILVLSGIILNIKAECEALPQKPTKTDIVKFCQELSATANEDWGYKSCLSEMEKTVESKVMQL